MNCIICGHKVPEGDLYCSQECMNTGASDETILNEIDAKYKTGFFSHELKAFLKDIEKAEEWFNEVNLESSR